MANFELGNPKKAARLLSQILESQPTHSAQQTQKYLESRVPGKNVQETKPSWFSNYTRLCQGRRLPEERSGDPLRCYLDGKRHAYFTLAPLQVELVHLDPDINVYHGMLSSKQILSIFEEADKEEMVRSAVAGSGGEGTVRDLRVSQQTWLDYKSPVMNSVGRIIQFVSGFDMAGAEHMQVANYGVGGQYEPHPDYFEVNLPKNFEGDRISTSMFYLSDVEQGGYTVFTKLNVFLPPVKGALVMWHNLHRSLHVDARTLHAGCPVIVGSKRIGNIWMHSGYQEFRRPCNLTSDSYKSLAYRD
uniref:RE09701p n=1 Tax=Drosophila melanogaster TaxID=7227 RepID=Q8IGX7_DROME|nr:RE09701p [Drosophila melanogaster]